VTRVTVSRCARRCRVVVDARQDLTLEVAEHREENSGLLQGTILKRQRVPKRATTTGEVEYFSFTDLAIGNEVTFYGRCVTSPCRAPPRVRLVCGVPFPFGTCLIRRARRRPGHRHVSLSLTVAWWWLTLSQDVSPV
jgi:hypothetical protein